MSHGRPFQKGQSGNPGGRSKAQLAMAKLIAEKTDNGAKLVELAFDVVTKEPSDHKSWQYCHNWLTERLAGKAPQTITLTDSSETAHDFAPLTDAQLEALAELDATADARVLHLVPPDRDPAA
jgi:hypothetical protein